MINPDVAIPLVIAIATPVAMFFRWLKHKERLAELAARPARGDDESERLARVERAIEAVALEVERIGEGQRYLTHVLGERARPGAIPAAKPRVGTDTPH
jgi:hypothetical protein